MKASHRVFARWFNPRLKFQNDAWGQLMTEAQNVNWAEVAELARQLPYEEHFLLTPYWRAVEYRVKQRDEWICQQCGREPGPQWLVVRHRDEPSGCTGSEHLHLEELLTLCEPCALRKIEQRAQAIIVGYEMTMNLDSRKDPLTRIVQELKSGEAMSLDTNFSQEDDSETSD